jgi:enoyl-CoA hydratase/carnithine racemase
MTNISVDVGPDGVAVATFDLAGRSMNTITYAVQAELADLATRLRGDEAIRGAVLRSGKASGFCAGADLAEMEGSISEWRSASTQDELRAGVESAGSYSRALRAIETCGKPVATILHGVALGGGLELALIGHRRIATGDASRLRLGLPEATIGLMPGAGGTQRLPRLMGMAKSLPHLLNGAPITLEAAIECAIVHEYVDDESLALETARHWVLGNPASAQPWDTKGYRVTNGPHSPAGYGAFPYAVAATLGDGPGDHAARANILRSVYEGMQVPIDAALRIEARYFFNTARAASADAMVRTLFAARQALGKEKRSDLEPYRDRLVDAWSGSARRMVQSGAPAALVRGVARTLSGKLPEPEFETVNTRSIDLPEPSVLERIKITLLVETAHAAEAALAENLVQSRYEADLVAVELGYPAWTGGPLSYLDATTSTDNHWLSERMDKVISDGDLALAIGDFRDRQSARTIAPW